MKIDISTINKQLLPQNYVDYQIKYHKSKDKNLLVTQYWEIDLYFEGKEKYSGGRENRKFESFQELQEFLNKYELKYNL